MIVVTQLFAFSYFYAETLSQRNEHSWSLFFFPIFHLNPTVSFNFVLFRFKNAPSFKTKLIIYQTIH